ncbi:MAG: AIR synthase family protein [Eubacteriaceae bacterium]|nr:AIR synthase family protein [Eubacteriaceae bacterium]
MLKTGKLDSDLLEKIVFDKITYRRPEVITRPGIGEDCAVVDYGAYECVMSTDPITAAISDIGRLSIHISCNDIASNGIQPIGILLAVMLPEGTTEDEIEEMMAQAAAASEALGVEIIGGHTEITPAVNKPVIVSTAIGRGEKWASQNAENMNVGDCILMTKSAGLEGSGVIACDYEEELKEFLTAEEIQTAKDMLNRVSVVEEGVIAGKIGTSGMHDITEGGILGAVWEMCRIGKVGAEVWPDKIPVEPVTRKICEKYDIDQLRLISSGCMMIMASPDKKDEIVKAVSDAGIDIVCIGRIVPEDKKICMKIDREMIEIAPPAGDEVYKVVGR